MKTIFQGELYVCDGCGKQEVIDKDDMPPLGYHGQISHNGAHAWEWFACKKSCVSKAIWAAEKRDLEEADG